MAKVYVIDDSAFSRMTMRRALEDAGHHVEEAPGVDEALNLLESNQPDVIVSDYLMEGQTGADLVRQLNERGTDIPVIVLTADLQHGTEEECLEAGAVAVLHKPVNQKELLELVTQHQGTTT